MDSDSSLEESDTDTISSAAVPQDASGTDRCSSILKQYKNIDNGVGREMNVYRGGMKCSECRRPCDLGSEKNFVFRTLSCDHHNAIVCTDCYPNSRHLSKCKMKTVKFHV